MKHGTNIPLNRIARLFHEIVVYVFFYKYVVVSSVDRYFFYKIKTDKQNFVMNKKSILFAQTERMQNITYIFNSCLYYNVCL